MSWLLFMDESGHDHRVTPYEVRGGLVLHASRMWAFIQGVRALEQAILGTHLHEHGTEIKGSKLLDKDRFRWAQQGPRMDDSSRRKHALNFLNSSRQHRPPRRDEFTAYGQACLDLAWKILVLARDNGGQAFATVVPPVRPTGRGREDDLGKGLVFLFERYFYFLEEKGEPGLIVMDGSEREADRKLVRRMERYFTITDVGKERTRWVVPSPLFVESDMAYGVQVADLVLYCVNWAFRFDPRMTAPIREEMRSFGELVRQLVWRGVGRRAEQSFATYSSVFIPDPYEPRN